MTLEPLSAADGIRKAKEFIHAFGWPAYSPWQALQAAEKKLPIVQAALMWNICTREASKRIRRGHETTMLHPVRYIHVQEGQTKAGIDEYLLDCADIAEHHPLNGTK